MSLKAKLEAVIYAAETPVTLDHMLQLVKPWVTEQGAGDEVQLKSRVQSALEELTAEYASSEHGVEIRQVAGGYRISTKPEQHDLVRAFARSLKPPIRLSLPALETLAVIAYKQPATVPEISEIRGVDSGGVIGTLLDRKLITTSGRKQVIGRPILYKTTKEFLLRFGLKDVSELPSMEEFEKLIAESFHGDMLPLEPVAASEPSQPSESLEPSQPLKCFEEFENEGRETLSKNPAQPGTDARSLEEPGGTKKREEGIDPSPDGDGRPEEDTE